MTEKKVTDADPIPRAVWDGLPNVLKERFKAAEGESERPPQVVTKEQ